jgi:glycosyltransferase involved in cell wall biosynthesis
LTSTGSISSADADTGSAFSLSIFTPAYEAGRHIESVVARIPVGVRESVRTIWIVNDGSTDDTAAAIDRIAASRPEVREITFPENRGYGAAVKAALERVREEPVGAAVCLHADGQYAPEEVPRLLRALHERRLDLVQGSRHASGTALSGGMPLYKFVGGAVLTTVENVAFRTKMTDFHSGYLCYGRRALDRIPFESLSDSFDFDLEVIASARALGLRIGEVPVPTCYEDQVSHLRSIPYGLRALRVVSRYLRGRYGSGRSGGVPG